MVSAVVLLIDVDSFLVDLVGGQMIKEALMALQDKSGSSAYAIAKYMEEKHKSELPANFRKILSLQLKNSTAKGKLVKVRASFKLSELGKKAAGGGQAKVAPAKPAKVEKKKAKKPETKKVGGKRSRKAKPKQPKSIKSPAAKKVKKATAAA